VALNSAVFVDGERIKVTAIDVVTNPLLQPFDTVRFASAVAVTPTRVYVVGPDGAHAFDTGMVRKSFFAIPGGQGGGGIAVTSGGAVVVASRNGMVYLFK
jgi:hypothetical protein